MEWLAGHTKGELLGMEKGSGRRVDIRFILWGNRGLDYINLFSFGNHFLVVSRVGIPST